MEPGKRDDQEISETIPTDDSPTGWFNIGCALATKGNPLEAERALKIAINAQEDYPIAWAILSAVLLSIGRETDAEKAGKHALDQCRELKMTWPKLRSVMVTHAIQKGKDWKSPRRIVFEVSENTEWGTILIKLSESSNESVDAIKSLLEGKVDSEDLISVDSVETNENQRDASDVHEDNESTLSETPVDIKSAEPWFNAARVHMNARKYDEAMIALKRGLTIDPKNGDALLKVGTLLMKRESYDKAEESLRLAVKYIPESSDAWLQLGICLQSLEMWADSVDALKKAGEKNPRNVEIWVKLGEADYFRSLYQEAARSFLRALRINPNHIYALFYLGRCIEYQGNKEHALRIYNKLLNLKDLKNPEILEELAKSFHRLGLINSAERAKRLASYHRRPKL
jgi:tetratricopeptide (TPR) repeat protein